jgi:hypothetical protein
MATDDPIRASDADRDVVVAALREAYTAGRLDLEEFDERMSAAYASKTWGDLRKLTIDLPTQPLLGMDVPGRHPAAQGSLPAHRPRPETEPDIVTDPQPPQVRRRSPIGMLIPLAVWGLLVSHGTVAPGLVFLFIVVCVLVSISASIRRR